MSSFTLCTEIWQKNVRVHKVQLRNLKGKCLVTCFTRITMLHFVGLYYAVIDTSVIQNW